MENTKLPPGLKNEDPAKIKAAVKVWSQFVAWSWTEFLAFADQAPKELDKVGQEKELKTFFRKIFQDQARSSYAINSYGDTEQKPNAYAASITIKKLLMCKNNEISDLEVTLTLAQVYEKLTGQKPDIFSGKDEDETFMQKFHIEIVTDRFSGDVREISPAEKTEIREAIAKISEKNLKYVDDVQYISYFAYPPCPVFGKTTVTEERLQQWIQNQNEYGEPASDYLPPSAYIPISLS